MGVLIIVDLTARPGKAEELRQTFRATLPDTRAFEGCESCAVYADQDDPARLSIVETFTSRSHYERYFEWRKERGDLDRLGELLASPPALRFFDDIGA